MTFSQRVNNARILKLLQNSAGLFEVRLVPCWDAVGIKVHDSISNFPHADADAQHREALAFASEEREVFAAEQTSTLLELLQQNTALTQLTKELSQRIETLTAELHGQLCKAAK